VEGLGNWRCEVRYLSPDADVQPGDAVLTSGLGGVFPEGLRVGTVTSVDDEGTCPGKAAEVRPAAQLRRLEDVLLIPACEDRLSKR
jgi:rod shape-determining protein MreC